MNFYEVLVSSPSYHGKEALTYSSEVTCQIGCIAVVPLRNKLTLGVVTKKVPAPTFTTKSIKRIVVETPLPVELLKLLRWLHDYYPAPLGFLAQLLLPAGLMQHKGQFTAPKTTPSPPSKDTLPPLTGDQTRVLQAIQSEAKHTTFLLHGSTGTGKTRVYIELAKSALAKGKSVLILTPEIGLTPQLEQTLINIFPEQIITIHSNLTPAKRRIVWLQILTAHHPIIVLGPRSALFSPIKELGLIVVDEAHDQAYKQEQAPYYQALRVSGKLAEIHHAKLLLGTATPLVSEYWLAEAKQIPILSMNEMPKSTTVQREVKVVNLRERAQFPGQPHISTPLIQAIKKSLSKEQQSLVFLNRRGTARLLLCSQCGWTSVCPHCDLLLTYHGDTHEVRCHTCGYRASPQPKCLNCSAVDITFKSIGTKSIVSELQKEFPKARIKRFDTDTRKAERLEAHYTDILAGKVDILVGTQMLAKGLDLPKLAVVGVVVADTTLYFPDYTAEERTYQLLSQVIGRVGRGHVKGTVVIQTYNPQNTTILAALANDWNTFYQAQLEERRTYRFPPFYHVLKLTCERANQKTAMIAANHLASKLHTKRLPVIIDGPAPSFHEKTNSKYRWQLIIKAKQRNELLKIISILPSGWSYDIDPSNLL